MALIRSYSNVLPEVYLKVRPGVVLFAAAVVLTKEFVIVLVCLFMVFQNPLGFELLTTALESADFLWLFFSSCVSRHMISQMLGVFEHFTAAIYLALIAPDG